MQEKSKARVALLANFAMAKHNQERCLEKMDKKNVSTKT
jgi:hypothetical protein